MTQHYKGLPKLVDIEFHRPNLRDYLFTVGNRKICVTVERRSYAKFIFQIEHRHLLTGAQLEHIQKIIHGQEEWKKFDARKSAK